MKKVIALIENLNEYAGKIFSWSIIFLILLIFVDVFMRYILDKSFIWLVELEIYFFAFSFMLTGGYAFNHDKHVRVDLFYSQWSALKKAWVNLLGGILFLLPWCVISLIVCWRYALTSFKLSEGSAQAGGLPFLYILKFGIALGFLLLTLQAIASILQSYLIIRSDKFSNLKKEDYWER